MKVLQKISANGVDVQLEDWSENYSFHKPNDTIAFYPRVSGCNWIVRPGDKIRCEIQCADGFQADIFMGMLDRGEMTFRQLLDEAIKQNLYFNYTGKQPDCDGTFITLDQILI